MRMNKFVVLVMLFMFLAVSTVVHADSRDLTYKSIKELSAITDTATGDKLLVYDTSTEDVKTMDAVAPVVSGDLTFRSTLLAIGREGGASTVSSSSTAIDPTSQAYTVVRKCIGGNSCLEELGVGTILPDGTPGKVVVLVLIALDTDGSWIVTPKTSTVMTNVVLDAVGEMITLIYFNDTVGWVPMSVEGATVTYNVNSFTT